MCEYTLSNLLVVVQFLMGIEIVEALLNDF